MWPPLASGADSITGYNATDQVYLSVAQFGTSWATSLADDVSQSSAGALIAGPHNQADALTRVGVSVSSLHQANFHFSYRVTVDGASERRRPRMRG
jgi:Ca2+-binding RTX toxin-like protein